MKYSKNYTVYPVELLEIKKEASHTFTFIFNKPEELEWEEGAHTHLALDDFDEDYGWWQKKNVRHFSISSLAEDNTLNITTRLLDICSPYKEIMKKALNGDPYYIFKVGSRVALERNNKPIVYLTAGVAMATVFPVIRAFSKDSSGVPSMKVLNVDSSKEYLFKDTVDEIVKSTPNLEVDYINNRDGFYNALNHIMDNPEMDNNQFVIIGSDEFMIQVSKLLKEKGVTREHVTFDKKDSVSDEMKDMIFSNLKTS